MLCKFLILEGNLTPVEITDNILTNLNWAITVPFECTGVEGGRGFAYCSTVCYLAQLVFILTVNSKQDWNTNNNNKEEVK